MSELENQLHRQRKRDVVERPQQPNEYAERLDDLLLAIFDGLSLNCYSNKRQALLRRNFDRAILRAKQLEALHTTVKECVDE